MKGRLDATSVFCSNALKCKQNAEIIMLYKWNEAPKQQLIRWSVLSTLSYIIELWFHSCHCPLLIIITVSLARPQTKH